MLISVNLLSVKYGIGSSVTSMVKSQKWSTLSLRVVRWYLPSGKISSKKEAWHVSPLPGPLLSSVFDVKAILSFRKAHFDTSDSILLKVKSRLLFQLLKHNFGVIFRRQV